MSVDPVLDTVLPSLLINITLQKHCTVGASQQLIITDHFIRELIHVYLHAVVPMTFPLTFTSSIKVISPLKEKKKDMT